MDGTNRKNRLNRPGRAQRVPRHRLGTADGHFVGMVAKQLFDGVRFRAIVGGCARAVGVDVIYLVGLQVAIF